MGTASGAYLSGKEYYAKRQARIALLILSVIVLVITLGILYATVVKAKDPSIQVHSVELNAPIIALVHTTTNTNANTNTTPSTTTTTSATTSTMPIGPPSSSMSSSVNVSLLLVLTVHNPNRATFRSYDNSASLTYYGARIGYLYILPFDAAPHSTVSLAVGLNTGPSPYSPTTQLSPFLMEDLASGVIPLTTSVSLSGHVTTLGVFSHHRSTAARCDVQISLSSKSVQNYICK